MENRTAGNGNRSRSGRLLAVLMCLLLAVTMMPAAAMAQVQDDANGEGALKLVYRDGDQTLDGVKFDLYEVGTAAAEAAGTDLSAAVSHADAGLLKSAAEQLAGYVQAQGISPTASGTTDANGEIHFSSLKSGIYLVSGESKAVNENSFTPQKTLVNIPAVQDDEKGGEPVVLSVTAETAKTGAAQAPAAAADPQNENAETASDAADPAAANADQNASGEAAGEASTPTKAATTPDKVSIQVQKVWDDNENTAKKRPPEITVVVSKEDGTEDGTKVAEKKITLSEGWTWTFSDLAAKDDNGKDITYKVTEEAVSEYTTSMAAGSKEDAAKIQQAIETVASANAANVKAAVSQATSGAVDLSDNQAELLLKAVLTTDISKLTPEMVITAAKTIQVKPELTTTQAQVLITALNKIDISALKTAKDLVDKQPVTISSDGKTATVNAAKAAAANTPAVLTITNKYETKTDTNNVDNNTNNNGNGNEKETVSIVVTKAWLDSLVQGKNRPSSVTINLQTSDGKKAADPLTLSKNNNWKGTFSDLPVYDSSGKEITYTVTENKVDNYVTRMLGGNQSTLSTLRAAVREKLGNTISLSDDQIDGILSAALTMDLSATASTNSGERTVYVSKTEMEGNNDNHVYHYLETKAGGSPTAMTESEAKKRGLTACDDDACKAAVSDNSSANVSKIITLGKQVGLTLNTTTATALLKVLQGLDLSKLVGSSSGSSALSFASDRTKATVKASAAKGSSVEVLVMNVYNPTTLLQGKTDDSKGSSPDTGTKTTTTTTSTKKLPQTGVLWWPVPVLALLGVLFFLTGFGIRLRQRRSQDARDL